MAFSYRDFASDVPMPTDHHTAQALWCFYQDPYVYYKTYVEKELQPQLPTKNTAEMLYKYQLLCGIQEFTEKFNFDAPINPSTKKPYGEDTQKYVEWAKSVTEEGKMPIHPQNLNIAHDTYLQTVAQTHNGFFPRLKDVLEPKGFVGVQETATVDASRCYAHIDYISTGGDVYKIVLVHSLDKFNDVDYASAIAFNAAYDYVVLSNSENGDKISPTIRVIAAEYISPFRVSILRVQEQLWTRRVMSGLYQLNRCFNGTDNSSWKSKYHSDTFYEI